MKKEKKRKALAATVCGSMLAIALVGGTLAYLQDDDSDVNVMTLGNVKIDQVEQERDADGNLVDFTDNKPLFPAVYDGSSIPWADEVNWVDPDDQAWKVVESNANVIDKFVTVKNTGKSEAYVRTLVAVEVGDNSAASNYVHVVANGGNVEGGTVVDWQWLTNDAGEFVTIVVDDATYEVAVFTYLQPLASGDTTVPSLKQVYLGKDATNEVVASLGDEYTILALSQAVQTAGFDNAEAALNASFPGIDNAEVVAGWFEGVLAENATDTWDGTADTSWYNETDTEFELTSAEQFAGFANMVAEDADNFEGKTITLGTDIDLNGVSFAPIGSTGERDSRNRLITEPFKGTFDGNGHTISGLSQSGWDFGYEWGQYGSIGLFSELESATVKNVVIEGFDCQIEGGDISFIAGSATGNCTFENIEIKSGSIGTYNNGIGGIIGWSGAGTYNFKNITIGEDVVIGGLWGSFDSSIGGIVGQAEPGATYNFENVDIACRIDAYNDCTASYDYYNYRMCGMIIGRLEETTTIDGVNYPDTSKYNITCNNVTVTYGEWANYHYCEPTPGLNNGRGMRVEPGYAYDGLPADYDHSQCVDNCMILIPFDQIFGGAQLGVKGLPAYDGVTVIYNNK